MEQQSGQLIPPKSIENVSETTYVSLLLVQRALDLLGFPFLLLLMDLQLARRSLKVAEGLVPDVDRLVDDAVEEGLVV